MKQVNRLVLLLTLILVACSTGSKKQSPSAYLQYFTHDAYARVVETNAMKYEVRLLTPEYMALQSSLSETRFDKQSYKQRMQQIGDNLFFVVKIFNKAVEEDADKAVVIRYYESFARNNAHILVNGSQFIAAEYVNYEDNYGLAPYNTLLFCFRFPQALKSKEIAFSYRDDIYENEVKASYSSQDLSDLPSLTL